MFKKIFKKSIRSRIRDRDEDENGEETTNNDEVLKICRECYAFGYENSWHFEQPSYLESKNREENVSVKFTRCKACMEEALTFYDVKYA